MKLAVCLAGAALVLIMQLKGDALAEESTMHSAQALPQPRLAGDMSVEQAIAQRRSVREFTDQPLTRDQIAQLCWAGQGVTEKSRQLRAAPSAGATFPIELYVVTAASVDRYEPRDHTLHAHLAGDVRPALQAAAHGQESVGDAPATFVIAACVERTAGKYGARAERYCFMEAGHVAQNVFLQATALQLAGVPVGAFDDAAVAAVLKLPKDHRALYLLPIGQPR